MHPFLSEIIEQLSPGTHWSDDQILREEIFSIERLEEHARSLAAAQPVGSIPGFGRSLATRLRSNEKVLLAAYRSIAKAVDEGRSITPAAEWVLDNYHVVEEQIREIREDLPPQFYRQLPKLTAGPFAGFPRVFGIAWAFVAHTDSRFEPEILRRFVRAYQSVEPLTIGELWAVAITLRIVLVENLRRVAQRIVTSRLARQEADAVADRLLGVNGQRVDPNALRNWRAKSPTLKSAFAVQLVHRLRDQDPKITPALLWLEEELAEHETSSERLLQEEHLRQGASNVTVRNIITSMRLMSDVDWAEFFEHVSLVDDALSTSADFAAMDFATRNLYRNAIEELGRGSKLSELEIAEAGPGHRGSRHQCARTRSWLSPDRGRPPEAGARHRLPRFLARLAEPHRLHRGCTRLRRGHRVHLSAGAVHSTVAAATGGHPWRHALVVRRARRRAGRRRRGGAHQPRGHARRRREPAAGPRTA